MKSMGTKSDKVGNREERVGLYVKGKGGGEAEVSKVRGAVRLATSTSFPPFSQFGFERSVSCCGEVALPTVDRDL